MPGVLQALVGAGAVATPSVSTVFDIDLWTGTGAARSITTPFAPDMVWIKSRSAVSNHALFDVTQGTGKYFTSNYTATGQYTDATTLTAFNSNGYSLGTDTNAVVNTSAATYVGWAFKKATKFFDIVSFTGSGANRTLSHSLGVAPGMILVQDLGGTSPRIGVYHRSLGNTDYLWLSNTNGVATNSGYWNNTSPTSTDFTLGTSSVVNFSGDAYVAYLFAHDPTGFVQCGTFTTDGSGNATVTLGWEPQFLLAKVSSTTSDWAMLDQTRGWAAGNDNYLLANSSAVENTFGPADAGAPTSTGFTYIGAASTTYVYMAIRKP